VNDNAIPIESHAMHHIDKLRQVNKFFILIDQIFLYSTLVE